MEFLFFALGIATAFAGTLVYQSIRRAQSTAESATTGKRTAERKQAGPDRPVPRAATATQAVDDATTEQRVPGRRAGRSETGRRAATHDSDDGTEDPSGEELPTVEIPRSDSDAPDQDPEPVDGEDCETEPPPLRRVLIGFDPELLAAAESHLEMLAAGAGSELGDLATAVEGHANLLCEAIGDPEHVAQRAEQLWTGVRRMRLFSEKLLAFARPPEVEPIPMELLDLVQTLLSDLESYASGAFHVHCELAPILPPANVDPEALRMGLLFLVDTLLTLQPNTRQMSLRAFTRIPEDESPIVCIQLCAEVEPGLGPVRTHASSALQLGYLAARNLLSQMNAHLAFEHVEELDVSCEIMLAAVLDTDEPQIGGRGPRRRPTEVPPSRHHFGGILILEDDRSVRELLAMELGRTGRSIVTCADGAAARSLIEATPERFELIVLDSDAPMESGERLACEALALEPGLKVLLLTDALQAWEDRESEQSSQLVRLRKPFNLSDLRDAVGELMGACPPPPLAVAMSAEDGWAPEGTDHGPDGYDQRIHDELGVRGSLGPQGADE